MVAGIFSSDFRYRIAESDRNIKNSARTGLRRWKHKHAKSLRLLWHTKYGQSLLRLRIQAPRLPSSPTQRLYGRFHAGNGRPRHFPEREVLLHFRQIRALFVAVIAV